MMLCLSSKREKSQSLPGDELVAVPSIVSTHAVTIDAGPEKVWPWIVQIGQGRGGFYSYTMLENLIGCQMKNADKIHAQWQNLREGDSIRLHPKFPPMRVQSIDLERHLVLSQHKRFHWTWAFVLERLPSNRCRLLVRSRINSRRWGDILFLFPVMTLGHYLMERRMLIGIKNRSEQK